MRVGAVHQARKGDYLNGQAFGSLVLLAILPGSEGRVLILEPDCYGLEEGIVGGIFRVSLAELVLYYTEVK